jgi:hypothetical protein
MSQQRIIPIILYYVILYYVILYYIILCYTILFYVILYYVGHSYIRGAHNFQKNYEPPKDSISWKVDMKRVPCKDTKILGTTAKKNYSLGRPGARDLCTPVIYISYIGRLYMSFILVFKHHYCILYIVCCILFIRKAMQITVKNLEKYNEVLTAIQREFNKDTLVILS